MKFSKYKGWRILHISGAESNYAFELFDKVTKGDFELISTLKNDQRSTVKKIRIANQVFVYKVPKEKNTRLWIRFLTWFRAGEAFKNIKDMELLWEKDIKTTNPILAAEKRENGMVVDSWLLYEYLEGHSCLNRSNTYPKVVKTLKDLHGKGLLHGDPQIRNFMVSDEDIYVIDANPKSTGFIGFDKAFEFAYLNRSAPDINSAFGEINNWWLFKLARWYDLTERKLKRKKRALFSWLNPFSG